MFGYPPLVRRGGEVERKEMASGISGKQRFVEATSCTAAFHVGFPLTVTLRLLPITTLMGCQGDRNRYPHRKLKHQPLAFSFRPDWFALLGEGWWWWWLEEEEG